MLQFRVCSIKECMLDHGMHQLAAQFDFCGDAVSAANMGSMAYDKYCLYDAICLENVKIIKSWSRG